MCYSSIMSGATPSIHSRHVKIYLGVAVSVVMGFDRLPLPVSVLPKLFIFE